MVSELERCPKCGAAVRAGSEWCTLCYADLRPAPVPATAPAPPGSDLAADELASGAPLTAAAEALQAALGRLGRPSTPGAGGPPRPAGEASAAAKAQWPCLNCGASNSLLLSACATCGAEFSLEPRTDTAALKLQRRNRLIYGLVAAGGFMSLVLLLTVLTGGKAKVPPGAPVATETPTPQEFLPGDGVAPTDVVPATVEPQPSAPFS